MTARARRAAVDEPELHLGSHVLVPDLAGWRRERMPAIVADEPFFTLAPDWVCEVISPRTATVDRVRKRRIYGEQGVTYLWFVDPIERLLEAFKFKESNWVVIGSFEGTEKVRVEPFDAIELDLSIFGRMLCCRIANANPEIRDRAPRRRRQNGSGSLSVANTPETGSPNAR